ncbi:hypothetical protein V8J88_09795 [Massilia sp. W12]|uniref:hypothetical protein n=1 Tax=Massilia sp. W12 TaxID=3126507 RepID=UPI0030D10701
MPNQYAHSNQAAALPLWRVLLLCCLMLALPLQALAALSMPFCHGMQSGMAQVSQDAAHCAGMSALAQADDAEPAPAKPFGKSGACENCSVCLPAVLPLSHSALPLPPAHNAPLDCCDAYSDFAPEQISPPPRA